MKERGNRGFSLLELLIVVAIILIIATIAIPSLVSSRQAANETSAVQTIKAIQAAEILYSSSNRGSYGTLQDLAAAGYLDDRFAAEEGEATVNGYIYTLTVSGTNDTEYTVQADPVSSSSGRYDYYSTADTVVRHRTELGGRTPGEPVQ